MTSNRQLLQTQFAPLTSKRNQKALFDFLQQRFPHAKTDSNSIMIGDPDRARLIVSAGFGYDPAGVQALTELAQMLTAPLRERICLVYADKPGTFPGKLHIRLRDISKGNTLVIAVSAGAREYWGDSVKKAFQPGKSTALRFKKAEGLLRRFGDAQLIFITAKKKFPLSEPIDQGRIKLVCDGVLRLLKICTS